MRLIKNGQVLIDNQVEKKDILIDEGKIIQIDDSIVKDCEVIDAAGLTVIPGLVDVHVHFREPGHTEKETIHTGSLAAAHGGFTSVFAMPNVIPFPDDVDTIKDYQQLIEKESVVHTYPYACITLEEASKEVVDMKAIKELGIRWFSEVVTSKGWLGIPSACESAQLIRDLEITKEVGNAYHACHISAKESVEALKGAKASGLNVSAEVTVHHLLLEDKDVVGPNWKMNPPLRSHEDRMSLIEGLENGTLDCIANDHAPHTYEEKKRSMDKAPFGIVSLESAFALLYTEFVHRQKRWTLAQLVNWMSASPAKRFGLENVGQIKEGYNADLVLVDLEHESLIDIDTFESMGKNTPFNGWSVNAQIKETIVDGKTVWKG